MMKGHPQIVLFQPEIPQNTGNIGRLAAATQSRLHLICPLGFSMDDKNMRRAGLDYWPYLDLEIHEDFERFYRLYGKRKIAYISKFGKKPYTEIPKDTEFYMFGKETTGLPKEFHDKYFDDFYHIPMFHPKVRSLNLANAVSIVVYDHMAKNI